MKLVQSSFPSSIEATLSFVSEHGNQDLLCDRIPGAETWQKCPRCDRHPQGGFGESVQVAQRGKHDEDSCFLKVQRSCSELSTASSMSKSSTTTLVYRRRQLRRNSVACLAQASTSTKPSDGCLSAISSDAPSVATEKNIVPLVESENEAVIAPPMLPVNCNRGAIISKSESFTGFTIGEEPGSEEDQTSDRHKDSELCCINDTCSSSKSNMDRASAYLKPELDDTAECSFSGALLIEGLRDDMTEKDICILILRSHGLLEKEWPIRTCSIAEGTCSSRNNSCSRSCKVCDATENTLEMLICDHCEEAFHVSCCNPRIKKIPADEWFCHSCLKKKHKILKDKTTSKSLTEKGRYKIANSEAESSPIALMLKDAEPYRSSVRIGEEFQAEVPDWSGPIVDEVDPCDEPLGMNPFDCVSFHDWSFNQPSKLSSIGNWLQCRDVIEGVGDGVDGTICGKWRRAPLFEVQTDDWECFRSVLWDPSHADCAVPQELDTDEVLKQLKYIEMLKPRLAAKRRKLDHAKSAGSEDLSEDARNIHCL